MGCTESKAAKTVGSQDGAKAKNKNNTQKEKKKKNDKPAEAAAGIECFSPDDTTLANYLRYLDAVRQDAASKGIMPPCMPAMGFPPTPKSKGKPTPTSAASPSEQPHSPTVGALQGPPRTVSVYCCRPLMTAGTGEPMLVGRGLYSAVYLADMTVLAGLPDPVAAQLATLNQPAGVDDGVFQKRYLIAMKEIRLFARQRTLTTLQKLEDHVRHWSRVSAYCPGLVQCIHLEQVFDDPGKGPALSVAAPHTSPHYVEGVTPVHTFGSLAAGGDESTDLVAEGSAGNKNRIFGRISAARRGTAGTAAGGSGASTQAAALAGKGLTAASLATITEPVAPGSTAGPSGARAAIPNRIRIYVDFHRYGTLRNVQVRQMQQRFRKSYLHELTARALMYDVLKTLVHLHTEDTLQYDLNANTIFIHHPLRAVYHTFFPVYISDLAAGDWRALTSDQWKAALVLGDPATDGHGCYDGHRAATHGGSGPNNGKANLNGTTDNNRTGGAAAAGAGTGGGDSPGVGTRDQRPPELTPALMPRANGSTHHDQDALSPLVLAHPNPSMAVNLHDLQLDVSMVQGPNYSSGMQSPSSPGFGASHRGDGFSATHNNVSFVAAGLEMLTVTDNGAGGKTSLLEWNNERLKQCMEVNGYEDCEGPPLPSPHDGAECQEDQSQFMASAVHETVPSLLEPQSVAAINAAGYAGGSGVLVTPSGTPPSPSKSAVSAEAAAPSAQASPTPEGAAAASAVPGAAQHGTGGIVLWSPDRFPAVSVASAVAPETRHVAPPQTLTATMDTRVFADLTAPQDLAGSITVENESFFVAEQLKQLQAHLGTDLDRRRRRPPVTKLNHVATVRRVLAAPLVNGSTSDVPAYQYVSAAHAAPEALMRRQFSKASDVYAFAMTFIELVTPDGAIMSDCTPTTKPKTRAEKADYDETLFNNLCKWYNTRMSLLVKHHDAVAEEQQLPPCVEQPSPPPCVMPIPEHLSDECKRMLRWCLQTDPDKRPTAAQLLSSKYFLFGDWISKGEPSCPSAQLPEKPWEPLPASYEALAESAGLELLSSLPARPSVAKSNTSKRA